MIKNNKLVINDIYQNASRFQAGLAKIKIAGKYGYINKEGLPVIKPEYDKVMRMDDGKTFLVCKNGFLSKRYDYINYEGEIIAKNIYH